MNTYSPCPIPSTPEGYFMGLGGFPGGVAAKYMLETYSLACHKIIIGISYSYL